VASFVDTNILLYAISTDSAEVAKREVARQILMRSDLALSTQVLQEFYVQATRSRGAGLGFLTAARLIRSWTRFPVQVITVEIVFAAIRTQQRFGLSYWDSAIVEAARSMGCPEILTEDLQDHQDYDGVVAVNPFR
jgi:predicted nucleic acid-binding protein